VQFSRLRLSGFKSFVDPVDLLIEPGITGVVGPNGCGKSNLVEAMRWVMGETSPKSMRGDGMDDVIFAGTDRRPARNLAEVTLVVENADRTAPAAFNDSDLLEVSRRIERDSGSTYRVNGREVRARDVQLLFADAATGAHSPALVGQGRVNGLVTAKPRDRRAILEEASGIAGLHARRREAEQRLRAAESNLERLQDVVYQIETQCSNLKRQARQARRYRSVSAAIRKSEAAGLYRRWADLGEQAISLEAEFSEAERTVSALTQQTANLSTRQAEISAQLPERRKEEAEAAAAVQRLTLARDSLEAEERRRQETLEKLARQLEEVAADRAREQESREDAVKALERLEKERGRLREAQAAQREKEVEAKARLDAVAAEANTAEGEYDRLTQSLAEARGRKASLESDRTAIERRLDRLRLDREETAREIAEIEASGAAAEEVSAAEEEVERCEAALEQSVSVQEEAEGRLKAAREARDAARDDLSTRRSALAGIDGEISALETRLADNRDANKPAILERVKVETGFETALGAALGDDLEAPEDSRAPLHWVTLPRYETVPPLPRGARPLSEVSTAPPALARRLALTGVVESDADGAALASELQPGQRLVSPTGALWRWDGFVAAAGASGSAALRLEQRNRLEKLQEERVATAETVEAAEAALAAAESTMRSAAEEDAARRRETDAAEKALRDARKQLAEAEAEASRSRSRLAGLEETLERLDRESQDGERQRNKIAKALEEGPDLGSLEADAEAQRRKVEELRASLAKARAAYDALRRESQARRERLQAIDGETQAWKSRLKRADGQLAQLDEREQSAREEQTSLESSPEAVEAKRQSLMDELETAEARRSAAADRLAEAETALAGVESELKSAQERLAELREARARKETALEGMRQRREELATSAQERFGDAPEHLPAQMELGEASELPPAEDIDRKLERLKAERERLGAVNLRAEDELTEAEEQLGHLLSEREDLEGAIGRLRQAIGSLNREGRQRLLAAFDEVNLHFSEIFTTLFGGGEARLELVESDDPLEAGLEIMASPPGKRLQILSLLSGGEQALTALSLIFAVFLTNPAPICVLDEVDAPLDEANVERFCELLDMLIARTQTRFLVVTHNEVTMARMHRLFGVTMAERGVSQLVSVSLEGAEALAAAE